MSVAIGHSIWGHGTEGVLVLHGWFADHTVFKPVFPALDANTFKYAFVDFRGYGLSRHIPGEYSINEMAQDAVELADRLGWARFHVIGHSMGGSAAQRICVDAKSRIKSCVCLTPVPASGVPMQGEQLALFNGAAEQDANRRNIIDFSTGNRLPAPWLDHMVAESHRTTTSAAFAAYFRAWSATNFAAEVAAVKTPMLVAAGEHDRALSADVMQATLLKWYVNAALEILPNAGHYPMQETPVYLAGLMDSFMRRHV